MKKLALALALAGALAATGCGDSKTPILTYVARSNGSTATAPQLFKLNESTQQSTAVQIPIPTDAYYISPNSDATAVTYCRDSSTTGWDIFVMGLDGVEHQLTTNANACESVFSPDGKTIAFVSGQSGDYLIYTMNLDGSNQQALFTPPPTTAESFYPEFSADGKSLVFYAYTNSGPSAAQKHHLSARNIARTPAWLTQGPIRSKKARPAVTSSGITQNGWYVMNLTDTAPTFVYTPNSWWGPAVFSADGKKLLVTDSAGSYYNISSVNLDGTELTPLTASTDEDDLAPVPYKNQIMFNRTNSTNNSWDIYVMNQDGSNQQLVHSTADTWEALIESYASGY
jgi:Tol biopolymer transport system component